MLAEGRQKKYQRPSELGLKGVEERGYRKIHLFTR